MGSMLGARRLALEGKVPKLFVNYSRTLATSHLASCVIPGIRGA
jgi:hypothetical protein